MPQVMNYKAKSIIYFEGDTSEKIYILQSGKVSLISVDIENGQELREVVKTGEFFGVKSSLGRYPREETADVVLDSNVLVFTVPEFENLILNNLRVSMQMLKVFSNQLRRIHRQVRSLLAIDEQVNPETGLFNIGEYYYKNQKYRQALYAFRQYLTYYPAGVFQAQATEYLIKVEKYSQGVPLPEEKPLQSTARQPVNKQEETYEEKLYFNGVSEFSQENYDAAIEMFKKYISQNPDGEYLVKAASDIGKSLYKLKKYDDSIKHFSSLLQKFPKHPDIADFLLFIGLSFDSKGDGGKAESFYKKVVSMTEDGSEVKRKAKNALKILGGKK